MTHSSIKDGVVALVREALPSYEIEIDISRDYEEWLSKQTAKKNNIFIGYEGIMPQGYYEDGKNTGREHVYTLSFHKDKQIDETAEQLFTNLGREFSTSTSTVSVRNGGGGFFWTKAGLRCFEIRLICVTT